MLNNKSIGLLVVTRNEENNVRKCLEPVLKSEIIDKILVIDSSSDDSSDSEKLTKIVKNPNYRAVSTPFWNSLKMVGNQSTFDVYGTPYCGKGEPNQGVRVGHASPTCLFNNIEIFGGA